MTIEDLKKEIIPILIKSGANRAGLFGSCVRGELKEDSDIDILVDLKKDVSLLGFISVKQQIEAIVGRKVDLVEYSTLKPIIREEILKEEVKII